MPSLSAIRTALASTISTAVTDLTPYELVPEDANTPCFTVIPRASDFTQAFGRGIDKHSLDVLILVSKRDYQLAQAELDPYVNGAGADSIRQAVWNARTLGLTDTDATVTSMTDYGTTVTVGAVEYMSARLTVEVLTSGTA